MLPLHKSLFMLALLALGPVASAQTPKASNPVKTSPAEIILVEPDAVAASAVAQWKAERFKAVAVILDERASKSTLASLAKHVTDGGLDLYWWIEVARNPKLAAAHPEWVAALGSHDDWLKQFPKSPEPGVGEVAKAYPWVPIGYAEAFEAHLTRIDQLLERVPAGWRGLLLNDLQGGPSSCGCGNLLCRWAIDYRVRATTTALKGADVAARFVAEVRKRIRDKAVIPVWTTECELVDLPANKNQGRPGTGLCGTVGCATGACPVEFTQQWMALTAGHDGPIGLLALHRTLQRTQPEFGGGPGWLTTAISYLDRTLPAHGGKAIGSDRLWVVVEGSTDEAAAREAAARAGVGAVIVARAKIDQSYEPRIFRTKQ